LTETRLKIAVFIDFDNIEIGVKTTLGQPFDISAILDGIKERGEVITKVAYGDWKRAGDHGRLLSQHAIRMVQRNLTPGGDKNGADINLALDALEMAFTHDHINAFVIVGGDSDFITLVEKLKQYDKKVFVVGGRQFTSLVMQKNCNEFIAYENLAGVRPRGGSPERKAAPGSGPSEIAKALPLVKRALKVLVDREVSPQLGLLKSTLLQLDSTFSEKDYGASTFRDFIEKVAQTGIVTLRHAGRSLLVDLAETNGGAVTETTPAADTAPAPQAPPPPPPRDDHRRRSSDRGDGSEEAREAAESPAETPAETPADAQPEQRHEQQAPAQGGPPQAAEALEHLQRIFARGTPPRWPMYVRQVKQFLRGIDDSFDERAYGFTTIVEFLRTCQRENLLRLERDRQGVLRVFAGPQLPRPATAEPAAEGAPEAAPEQPVAAAAAAGVTDAAEVSDAAEPAAPAEAAEPEGTTDRVAVTEVSPTGDAGEPQAPAPEVLEAEPVADHHEPPASAEPARAEAQAARPHQPELPVQDAEPVPAGQAARDERVAERSMSGDGDDREPQPEDEVPVARPPMRRGTRKTAAAAAPPPAGRTRTPRARTPAAAPRTPGTRSGNRAPRKKPRSGTD
jgi:uncharacterized LabA/DUF88 family protein